MRHQNTVKNDVFSDDLSCTFSCNNPGSLQSRASRGPVPRYAFCRVSLRTVAMRGGVPDGLMVNYYIQYTSIVPSCF